jgi:diketogulonate reductase-like aldo/keto reductase
MRALDFLVEKKITRFIGVSNFSVKRLKAAQSLSKNKIIANQIEYNLLARNRGQYTRNMEQEIVPYCQENGILVVAYRPLAGGQLARPGIELLDEIAKKYSRTQAQVAINWLISKPGVVTIPKATNVEHTRENLGAVGWKMSAEDTERLNRFSS